MFIGRERELEALNKLYAPNNQAPVLEAIFPERGLEIISPFLRLLFVWQ